MLFPVEQERIVKALVQRVEVGPSGADIKLRSKGSPVSFETWDTSR